MVYDHQQHAVFVSQAPSISLEFTMSSLSLSFPNVYGSPSRFADFSMLLALQ